ncbi:Hypothetical predicted protein [Podarcis lilfordi]|uniref:Uncharacterized protein n=1 Tax=Podarcis lilfordi TaxID=74358 RepID=A0AA35PN12_9SAUR|nr:Hypothetical predicted protein [Podarcis lilfordi]
MGREEEAAALGKRRASWSCASARALLLRAGRRCRSFSAPPRSSESTKRSIFRRWCVRRLKITEALLLQGRKTVG